MQRVATIIDNRGRADYVQKEDVEDLTNEHVGDKIFSLFLNLDSSRVTSIIKLRKRTGKHSTYLQAAQTEAKHKDRRVTRQFTCLQATSMITSDTVPSKKKRCEKRRKRGSGKQHKTSKKVFAKFATRK